MLELPSGEVHIWCASLDVSPDTSARFHASLSADERSRSAGFRFERDQRRFVAAHGVLRELLGRYLQTPPERIRYVRNAFGKPDLGAEFGGRLRFNLSHSDGLALIAIAADAELGVDVEHVRAQPDHAEIARCFFSATEIEHLAALPSPLGAQAFIACWTRKEACLKACGHGLAIPLDSFSVPLATAPAEGPAELVAAPPGAVAAKRWALYALEPAPGYVGALAIERRHWRLSVRAFAP